MMLSPGGGEVFVEVCKTGSTAAVTHLRSNGWFQNGSRGYKRIPGTATGRHSYLTLESLPWKLQHRVKAFGVVRNPWDRMASLWRSSAPGTTTFLDFMTRGRFKHGGIDVLRFNQTDWLMGVDHVMRYEQLEEEWARHEALPQGKLPVVNRSDNRAKPEWTDREVALVAERFARDIERFGYEGPS